ncbi:STAS domain-containing protein [Candidatus Magnetomonas plexicatena]|uniref:STAS domain-containing protein n=1 Tax=Candidatus Magnetomonas plexicatena TaxID=2552947 RepID=UPI001C77C4C4|nr:STAS domain-containing protein [Nitrospirales bacterium LBB_01]
MDVTADKINGLDVISISGRMDATSASGFDEKMKEVLAKNPAKVVVSLKGLEYVSSAGLRSFLAAAKEIKKCEGKLVFIEPTEQVLKVLKMSGMTTVLKICNSMDEALKEL